MSGDAGADAEGRPKGTGCCWRGGHWCTFLVGQQDLQVQPVGPFWLWFPSPHGTRRTFQTASSPVVPVPLEKQGCRKGWHAGSPRAGYWRKEMQGNAFFGKDGQGGEEEDKEGIRMYNVCGRVRTV